MGSLVKVSKLFYSIDDTMILPKILGKPGSDHITTQNLPVLVILMKIWIAQVLTLIYLVWPKCLTYFNRPWGEAGF